MLFFTSGDAPILPIDTVVPAAFTLAIHGGTFLGLVFHLSPAWFGVF